MGSENETKAKQKMNNKHLNVYEKVYAPLNIDLNSAFYTITMQKPHYMNYKYCILYSYNDH